MSMALVWFFIGVGFLLIELAFPALVVIFFGLGAWAAAASAALGGALKAQCLVFIGVSLISLILLRRYAKAVFGGRARKAGAGAVHPLTGQQGVASRDLQPGTLGEVSIGGSFWRAVAETFVPKGAAVRVLGTLPDDELVLRVEPLLPPAR